MFKTTISDIDCGNGFITFTIDLNGGELSPTSSMLVFDITNGKETPIIVGKIINVIQIKNYISVIVDTNQYTALTMNYTNANIIVSQGNDHLYIQRQYT